MNTHCPPSLAKIMQGAVAIIPEAAFQHKIALGRPLHIKLGADPTAPDLHLGHAIVLRALRRFQEAGHHVIFLIGDFTARIGDPTGRSKTRPPLTTEQIIEHSATYFAQVSRVLDRDKITVRYNSEWLGTLHSTEWVKICAKLTLARLTEREDFAARIATHTPIGFHELLYPIMQGYDSVALNADIELGGTDQTFNLLVGRTLQEQFGQEPQVAITFPLLRGLDGVHKMSKSQGNIIGLTEPATTAFGKLMSISDELMWHYRELLLEESLTEIIHLREAVAGGLRHPMDLKKDMAYHVIAQFWSKQEAEEAAQQFNALFQKRDYSAAVEQEITWHVGETVSLMTLLKSLSPDQSSSDIRRLIIAGAVSYADEKVVDPTASITIVTDAILKIGKHRFLRLKPRA